MSTYRYRYQSRAYHRNKLPDHFLPSLWWFDFYSRTEQEGSNLEFNTLLAIPLRESGVSEDRFVILGGSCYIIVANGSLLVDTPSIIRIGEFEVDQIKCGFTFLLRGDDPTNHRLPRTV